MTLRSESGLQVSLAVVQALGAIVGVVGYFLVPSKLLWTRLVWSILAVVFVAVCIGWFLNRRRRAGDKLAETELQQAGAPTSDVQLTFAKGRIHCLIPLTVWSALASMVVIYMSNHRTALLIVALAPVWVGILTLGVTRLSRHRPSVITMGALCCGLLGAWLGSDGDSGTLLGFSWYSLAGYLVARVWVDRDATVSIVTAVICSALFIMLTALIMGRDNLEPLLEPSGFVRSGAPYFAMQVYLILSGRWIAHVWVTTHAGRKDGVRSKRLPE
jgi:hypothetical protein